MTVCFFQFREEERAWRLPDWECTADESRDRSIATPAPGLLTTPRSSAAFVCPKIYRNSRLISQESPPRRAVLIPIEGLEERADKEIGLPALRDVGVIFTNSIQFPFEVLGYSKSRPRSLSRDNPSMNRDRKRYRTVRALRVSRVQNSMPTHECAQLSRLRYSSDRSSEYRDGPVNSEAAVGPEFQMNRTRSVQEMDKTSGAEAEEGRQG
ncbi:hypothetical protein KM043_003688 [Ampulex compressa]|nr:hypothetical protein KM043_003688 [Ampulex compressa]